MKPVAISSARMLAAACALALVSGWTSAAQAQAAGQWKDPMHVYAKICSNCHETGIGPVIKGRDDLAPEYYQYVVRNGLRAMPAFRITDVDTPTLKKLSEILPKMVVGGGGK